MSQDKINIKKIPVRSKMPDEELAALIKKAMEENPEAFSPKNSGESSKTTKYTRASVVNEVLVKWL